ncbi:MAG: hypothetical protein PSV35_04015, partial [bacterium]|nr:hypothetical protein [bacterium]
MTIFVDVLVKLIREHLSHISSNLTTQSKGVGYNHKLSLDQKDIISTLEAAMVLFKSTHDDKADSEAIAKLLTASRIKIQEIREKHGEPREEGKTRACLVNLILHTTGFYTKLAEFPFNLLNKEHTSTPENIVYYHACYYFGEEIFDPKAHSDVGIRAKKEGALEKRLQSLSELIKPTYTLQEQRIRTLQVLEDLAADNKIV